MKKKQKLYRCNENQIERDVIVSYLHQSNSSLRDCMETIRIERLHLWWKKTRNGECEMEEGEEVDTGRPQIDMKNK